ncbi:MAG: hypothetical protein FWD78_15065 [Treponema sp.]|nr:hypothetical protein [Treponema sp.]
MKKSRFTAVAALVILTALGLIVAGCDNPINLNNPNNPNGPSFNFNGKSGSDRIVFNSIEKTTEKKPVTVTKEIPDEYEFVEPEMNNEKNNSLLDAFLNLYLNYPLIYPQNKVFVDDADGSKYVMWPTDSTEKWLGRYEFTQEPYIGKIVEDSDKTIKDGDKTVNLGIFDKENLTVEVQTGIDKSPAYYLYDKTDNETKLEPAEAEAVLPDGSGGYYLEDVVIGHNKILTGGYHDINDVPYDIEQNGPPKGNEADGFYFEYGTGELKFLGYYDSEDEDKNLIDSEIAVFDKDTDPYYITGYEQVPNGEYKVNDELIDPTIDVEKDENGDYYYMSSGNELTKITSASFNITVPKNSSAPSITQGLYGDNNPNYNLTFTATTGSSVKLTYITDYVTDPQYSIDGINYLPLPDINGLNDTPISIKATINLRIDVDPVKIDTPVKVFVSEKYDELTEPIELFPDYDLEDVKGDIPVYAVPKNEPIYTPYTVQKYMEPVGGDPVPTAVRNKTQEVTEEQDKEIINDITFISHTLYIDAEEIGEWNVEYDSESTLTVTFVINDDITLVPAISCACLSEDRDADFNEFIEVTNNTITFDDYTPGSNVFLEANYSFSSN